MKYSIFTNNNMQVILKKIADHQPKAFIKIRVAKWLRKIQEEAKDYEDARKAALEKYAEKDEAGKPVMLDDGARYDINPENMKALADEMNELIQVSFELPEMRASWIQEPLSTGELLFMLDYVTDDLSQEETKTES